MKQAKYCHSGDAIAGMLFEDRKKKEKLARNTGKTMKFLSAEQLQALYDRMSGRLVIDRGISGYVVSESELRELLDGYNTITSKDTKLARKQKTLVKAYKR